MDLYSQIINQEEKISLVGLGYVGIPIAVAFAKKVDVIGYDYNAAKIELYKRGVDSTNEVGNDIIAKTTVQFTNDPSMLRQAKFHIVAVPTPVNDDHTPDLFPVESASAISAVLYLFWVIFEKLAFGIDIPGYATIIVLILALGAMQLVCIGIIGEYVGRTFEQSKGRPVYLAKEILSYEDK